jgi:tetratricopeptide (TPR) repeat protein
MLRRSLACLALALAASFGSPALAAEPPPGSPKAIQLAKRHFERARAAYGMGSYKTAIDELETAIRFDPKGKDLYYNLGLVHEKLGNIDPAIDNFKRAAEMEEDPNERERIGVIIARLEGAREEIARPEEPVAVTAPPSSEASAPRDAASDAAARGRMDGWVYATGGVAVAALAVGTIFGVRALSTRPSDSDATGPGTSIDDLHDRNDQARSYALIADIAFAVSVVSGGTAAFLYFSRTAEPSASGALTSVSIGGRF